MRGIEELNFPAFSRKAYELRRMGWEVFNPAEEDTAWKEVFKEEPSIRYCLFQDLGWICQYAESMYMMKGWETSLGARAEHATAVALGLEIQYE